MAKGKSKRHLLTNWCPETVNNRLKNLERVPHEGNWRKAKTINVQVVKATVRWVEVSTGKAFEITSPVPTGMMNLFERNQSAQNRNWNALPKSVKEHFKLESENKYNKENYKPTVTFSGLLKLYLSPCHKFLWSCFS